MGVHLDGSRSRRSIVLLAAVAALSLLTGCSSSGSSSSADASTTTSSGGRNEQQRAADGSWTSDGLAVHSQLSATKESIVYAGVDDTELEVIAVDPTTGEERWRHRSDVSDRINGVELRIYTDDAT